jgi:type I restriction enzyme, S subunit
MSEQWKTTTIRQCLVESFAGEWGTDPKPGNTKVLRATDIDDDGHVVGPGAIRQLPIGKLTSKRLLDGDILLEGSGGGPGKPVGRVAYFEASNHYEVAVCSNFFKTLRPKRSEVEPRFLLRKLAWFYRQPALLTLQQQTTGIINLKFEEYLSAQIEMPETIVEQQKLAQVFDTLDIAIHETEAVIAKLNAAKQGLLHDLLTRGIDTNGELRLPQAEAPQLYKESPLGWIPREWDTASLGDLAESLVDGPFGSNLKTAHYVGDPGVRVVRLQNILSGEYDDTERAFISDRHATSLARNRVTAGDALIASLGDASYPVGRSCCYPEELPDAINKADCFRFRSASRCLNEFVMHSMNGAAARKQVRGYEQGVTMKRINLGNLRRIEIAIPLISEQEQVVERLAVTLQQIASTEHLLQKLRYQKFGLMDDLLTGCVRVTPLLDKAARQKDCA